MPSWRLTTLRIAAAAVFALAALCLPAEQAPSHQITSPTSPAPLPTPVILEHVGAGVTTLSAPWQFHVGDEPGWADPTFNTSNWEQLTADQPWGKQGHPGFTGFGWYRTNIAVPAAVRQSQELALLVPKIKDAYEIYWNGNLVGRNGNLPPTPVRLLSQPPQTFDLGPARQGTLAVRVWKAPLLSDDSNGAGGFWSAPLIGSAEAIATAKDAADFEWLRSRQFLFAENLLCAVIGLLSLMLWLRGPSRSLLFWTAGFALSYPINLLLLDAHLAVSYVPAMAISQIVSAIGDVSLWFLLLWLLPIGRRHALWHVTTVLAALSIVNAIVEGVLIALNWNPQWSGFARTADVYSTFLCLLLEAFPLVLVSYALVQRRQFDPARWLVATLAFTDEMLHVFSNIVKQGRQLTDWSIADNIDAPLFSIDGNGISLSAIAGFLLFIAIVYAVYNDIRKEQRRRDVLEQERIELIRESNLIRHQAEHDGLTGLWNHRVIVERLEHELIRSLRQGAPISVVLIDVDHFKKINDAFGHLSGDLVLKEISNIFTRSLRPYDSVGRYGGEEFLLILPNCEIDIAYERAEQLRQAVETADIIDGDVLLRITASFGVASPPFNCDAETLLRSVDTALYRAKDSGRNRVILAEMEIA